MPTQLVSRPAPRLGNRPVGRRAVLTLLCAGVLASAGAQAGKGGKSPEDIMAGELIVADSSFPTRWTSPASFAAECRKKNLKKLFYAKKTEKIQIYYAAFFRDGVNDVEVRFVLYDITNGTKAKKGSWEAFLNKKGDRALFNSVELEKADLLGEGETARKYLVAIEHRGQRLASTELMITAEPPKYSGKVEFSDEDTKKKE